MEFSVAGCRIIIRNQSGSSQYSILRKLSIGLTVDVSLVVRERDTGKEGGGLRADYYFNQS